MGVNLIAALTKRVAKTLDDSFDIEILEMHHNKKIDAPSGTALMFGRAAAEGRGIDLAQHSARGRDGETGARKPGDIGFASLARRHRGRRAQRDLRRSRRAHRTRPPRRGPHDLRARRAACGAVGARAEARPLFDGRRAGAEGFLTRALATRPCRITGRKGCFGGLVTFRTSLRTAQTISLAQSGDCHAAAERHSTAGIVRLT